MKSKLKIFSILDQGFNVEGKVISRGQLIVKGSIRGHLEGEDVIIAEDGTVFAKAEVLRMTVGGTFEGDVNASEELIVLSTGRCKGKVTCKNFIVEAGGVLDAEVNCYQELKENSPVYPNTVIDKAEEK